MTTRRRTSGTNRNRSWHKRNCTHVRKLRQRLLTPKKSSTPN